jgi:hypothetical protein
VPNFTEESLQRIIINPFYAITLASQLTEEHEPAMDEAEWVRANSSLIGEMGAARWLRQLLDVLEGKAGTAGGPIDPSQAINIDPLFAVEHPPLIEREMWVEVNVMHISNMGAEGWLSQLLDVLGGDIVTAEEVGFTPPGGPFGYGAPGHSTVQRRVKKRRNKRRRAEVGAYEAARPDGKQGESTTPQKHTAVYVYATRQDPPGNLADQLITYLEQATKQENQQVATYVDIQPGYRYNLKDALAYAVHYVFEHGESISLARTFVRLLCSDRYINELLYELERHGIDPLSVLDRRIPQQEKIVHILREYAEKLGEQ